MLFRKAEDSVQDVSHSKNRVNWLIEKSDGGNHFEMRIISIPVGGKTSYGSHPHEHEIYVLSGKGYACNKNEKHPLYSGICGLVKGNEEHQFVNESESEPLRFICVIPSGAEDEIKKR